jgi:hypothetical protein
MLDFVALTMIEASIERVFDFRSYPAMVIYSPPYANRRRPANAVLLAGGLTYVGIFFTVGGFDLAELTAKPSRRPARHRFGTQLCDLFFDQRKIRSRDRQRTIHVVRDVGGTDLSAGAFRRAARFC